MAAYLIQAEFFHVGNNTTGALGKVLEECIERTLEGSRIKTVVRFFDDSGTLAQFIIQSKVLDDEYIRLLDELEKATDQQRQEIYSKLERVARRKRLADLPAQRLSKKLDSMRLITRLGCEIAVERPPDHHFELARGDELHELFEAASCAKSIWLFAFEGTDLLADKLKSVAYAM